MDFDDPLSTIEGEIEGNADHTDITLSAETADERDHPAIEGFDEIRYLRAFPDIAQAIARGDWKSGFQHYSDYGIHENRLSDLRYVNVVRGNDTATFPTFGVDAAFVTRAGWCLVIGWVNDDSAPLREILILTGETVIATTSGIARCRRQDAEGVVTARHGKLLGFWTVLRAPAGFAPADKISVSLIAGPEQRTVPLTPQFVAEEQLREVALEYLASAQYFANPQTEAALQLHGGLGRTLIDLNIEISRRVIAGAYVLRFGPIPAALDGSIIVCLYGRPEYLFLQAAAFAGAPGADRYEFIYVSNSPELAETLIKEATMAARIYGLAITLVILPSNAGFGAANNIAAEHARSQRIMITNPDVFPRDRDWATRHTALIAGLPPEQTAIFGAPLFYDDGSLMHAGMFFDIDTGVSIRDGQVERSEMIRVEHYAKGAPPGTQAWLGSRIVPAVTGAFISLERSWFEALGGFSPEYVFGHYEDADLCLKSLSQGTPVWVHHFPLWHLEGKGSTRRHVHEGGSIVNRWYFTELWRELLQKSSTLTNSKQVAQLGIGDKI